MFSGYVGIYRRKKYVGGCPRGPREMFLGYVGLYRRKKYVGGRPRGPRDREARPIGGASYLVGASAAS